MAKFEKVSRFANVPLIMPERKTAKSAGYDFEVAEDITLEPYIQIIQNKIMDTDDVVDLMNPEAWTMDLDMVGKITKHTGVKPTLVSTGMKCKLADDEYLELSVRSSCPLKYWLVLANGVGIIDADYYNNPDNEGEIFFQLINLSPFNIVLHKGDRIGQGIIHKYIKTEDDAASGDRLGGYGSTGA